MSFEFAIFANFLANAKALAKAVGFKHCFNPYPYPYPHLLKVRKHLLKHLLQREGWKQDFANREGTT